MSNVEFASVEGFLAWLAQPGNNVQFPYPGPKQGWNVRITGGESPTLVITSGFYEVRSCAPYGAPKICGHQVEFAGINASGVVTFGFKDGTTLAVLNRRRLTTADTLGEGEVLVTVTNECAPDRIDEPVAVVAAEVQRLFVKALPPDQRLAAYGRMRDGVELAALRALFAWADAAE